MKVYVDNFSDKNIGLIEVGYNDTVLDIKEKIWRCLRIPISNQFLYFKSKILLKDHLSAAHLRIGPNSHLKVYVVPNRNHPTHKNNQVLHQTNNSPAPSNSTQQIGHGHQDWLVKVRSNNSQALQTEQSPVLPSNSIGQDLSSMIKMPSFRPETTQKISNVQDYPVMARSKNEQVLQTEQSLVQPWTTEEIREVQSFRPERTNEIINSRQSHSLSETEELLGIQDYPVMARTKNKQVLQTEQSLVQHWTTEEIREVQGFWPERTNEIINSQSRSLSEIEELLGIQDCFPTVTVGSSSNTNQEFQPEQFSPRSLDFVKEILNIPDSPAKKRIKTSPMKLTVMVKPSEDTWRIAVEVNADDNVEELRKELVKMQERGELNLPQEGFFLLHEDTILNETQSFSSNGVTQFGTVEIFSEYFTSDDSTTTRVPSFGH